MYQSLTKQPHLLEYLKRPLEKHIVHRDTEQWSKAFWKQRKVVELSNIDVSCQTNGHQHKDGIFTIILPPPNITGNLHLGHALTVSLQDAIVRHQLMSGKKVRWIPGFDHAGLSTQIIVEKQLWKNSHQTRQDIGKEEFLHLSHQWKEDRIKEIKNQMDRFGILLSHDQEYFTMDEQTCRAVNRAFVQLHQDKLLYREARPVHWSPFIQSTISDIEVSKLQLKGRTSLSVPGYSKKIEFGLIYKFSFKILDVSNTSLTDEEIVVATTRIETTLGDVAIAVNPNDSRYHHLIGRMCIHPLTDRAVPIIGDEYVMIDKGTGAVKITPFVDDADWAMAKRHNLSIEESVDKMGKLICPYIPKFHGMKQFEARNLIIEALNDMRSFKGSEDYETTLPLCSRTGDIIEKRPLTQWFINCEKLATNALSAVQSGRIDLQPENYRNSLSSWLVDNGVKDWCISRQSWWGHRIPAYKLTYDKDVTDSWVAASNIEDARSLLAMKKGNENFEIHQDEDVLDTWFSSSLLPLSVFNWPGVEFDNNLNNGLFPLTLMETGFDILNYWVSRMIMLSLHLTQHVPFRKVLLHGMVCDSKGKKMSKSIGNVIDPLDIIDGTQNNKRNKLNQINQYHQKNIPECGPDVLRAYLLSSRSKKEVISIQIDNLLGLRKFTDKIWNSYRYILPIIEANQSLNLSINYNLDYLNDLSDKDKIILNQMAECVEICESAFSDDDLYFGYEAIHKFWVVHFCNNYLEQTKDLVRPTIKNNNQVNQIDCFRALQIQVKCLDTVTRLLHPYMPHLTELVYQKLRVACLGNRVNYDNIESLTPSICSERYPTSREWMKYKLTNSLVTD